MGFTATTPLDVAAQVDPNLRRDIFLNDDVAIRFGALSTDTNQSFGEVYYDSGANEFRIDSTRSGAGVARDIVVRTGNTPTEALRVTTAQNLLVGRSTEVAAATHIGVFERIQNAGTYVNVRNTSVAASVEAGFLIDNGTVTGGLDMAGSGTAFGSYFTANTLMLTAGPSAAQLLLRTNDSPIKIAPALTQAIHITTAGVVIVSSTVIVPASSESVLIRKDQNTSTMLYIDNQTSGTSAASGIFFTAGGAGTDASGFLFARSAGFTPISGTEADSVDLSANSVSLNGLILNCVGASKISMKTDAIERVRVNPTTGDVNIVNQLSVGYAAGTAPFLKQVQILVPAGSTGITLDATTSIHTGSAGVIHIDHLTGTANNTSILNGTTLTGNADNVRGIQSTIDDSGVLAASNQLSSFNATIQNSDPDGGGTTIGYRFNDAGGQPRANLRGWSYDAAVTGSGTLVGRPSHVFFARQINTQTGTFSDATIMVSLARTVNNANVSGVITLSNPFIDMALTLTESSGASNVSTATFIRGVMSVDANSNTVSGNMVSMAVDGSLATGGAMNVYHVVDSGVTQNSTSTLRGIFIDFSASSVATASSALEGIRITAPAAYGAATERAMILTGDARTVDICTDSFALDITGDTRISTGLLTHEMGTGTGYATMVGVANVNTTAVTTTTTGEDDLMTYTLPANSLNAALKAAHVRAKGTTTVSSVGVSIKLYWGGTAIQTASISLLGPVAATIWEFDAWIVSTGTDTQDIHVRFRIADTSLSFTEYVIGTHTTAAKDDGSDQIIKVTGDGTAAGQITQEFMEIEFIN